MQAHYTLKSHPRVRNTLMDEAKDSAAITEAIRQNMDEPHCLTLSLFPIGT